jgi:hypothetical protein
VMKHGPFSSAPEVSHESTRGVSRTRALACLRINHLLMTWESYRSQTGKLKHYPPLGILPSMTLRLRERMRISPLLRHCNDNVTIWSWDLLTHMGSSRQGKASQQRMFIV